MSWIPLALQVMQHAPTLIDSGIKIADAFMRDPAVSEEDKNKLLADLETKRAALDDLVARVKASKFTVPAE